MKFERGSEWRRWELHIHTPGTVKNDCFSGNSMDEKWNKYYSNIESYIGDGSDPTRDIAVIAITDYLSVENYKKVIKDNRLPQSVSLILPNVEMRIQPFANDSPLNIHFIFNPCIIDNIEDRFFSKLSFLYGNTNFSASRSELIRLGKTINDSLNDGVAYKKGIEQFVPSFDVVQKVFRDDLELRDNTMILVSNSSSDGVSGVANHADYIDGTHGDTQLKAFRLSVYKFVDGLFSSSPCDIKYFLGKKESCSAELVIKECGSLKPCVHGSDAHSNQKIFEPDMKKYCWIKADPTFNGLKQIVYEPEERVRISEFKPNYKPKYYVIDSIEFKDDAFQINPIKFNENLTCIIGGKSTGKSALLHNLAMAIDKEQVEQKESISKTNTRNIRNSSVIWADGDSSEPHKIVYVPQTYLNRLSDESESTTEIDNIVEEVVLIDNDIKAAHKKMVEAIKDCKTTAQKIILELLSNHNDMTSLQNAKKELGSRTGIESEIKELKSRKEELSKKINLSEDDLLRYEESVQKIKSLSYMIACLKEEINYIKGIESVVKKDELRFKFINETKQIIEESIRQSIEAANISWKNEKNKIMDILTNKLRSKEEELKVYSKTENSLKNKVYENKFIAELTEKIQMENDKLERFIDLDKKEKVLSENETNYINKLCLLINSFKASREEYADKINNNFALTSCELEFSVNVPFRKDAFLKKISILLNKRTPKYKNMIDLDNFCEREYTIEFMNQFVLNLLDDSLQTKNGNTKENVLREVFDDWYGIKYNIKMDNDTIDVMSPGKKALVLLKLLIDLAESKCPILIDQPEDDLDNRSIFEDLIPFIKKKKQDRQIIIVTHNANVVLGSDAEEVIVANQQGINSPNKEYRFEYRSGSIENDVPIINSEGNIELGILNGQGIQQHVCDILEGGEKAFELRKNKYHI